MLEKLRQRMSAYPFNDLPVELPEAAVLMPFVDQPDPELILTVRAQGMPTHAGEVAFPGGKRDPGDRDLLHTALRESHEEVGLAQREVEVIGQLSPLASRFGMSREDRSFQASAAKSFARCHGKMASKDDHRYKSR